jgi:hypothetical protein
MEMHGKRYEAHVFGDRIALGSKNNLPIQAIALDGHAALSESPARLLTAEETPPPGTRVMVAPKHAGAHEHPSTSSESPPVRLLVGDTLISACCERSAAIVLGSQIAAENTIGPNLAGLEELTRAAPVPTTWTQGARTALAILIDFSDKTGAPVDTRRRVTIDAADIQNVINDQVGPMINRMSYGTASLSIAANAITPVLRMPQPTTYYTTTSVTASTRWARIKTDAYARAAASGYNTASYGRVMIIFSHLGVDSTAIALGSIQGTTTWYDGDFGPETVCHELGHNFGLEHANRMRSDKADNPFELGDPSDFGNLDKGEVVEYGDWFDMMGGPANISFESKFFSPFNLQRLGWLPSSANFALQPTTAPTTRVRLHRFDRSGVSFSNRLAVQIQTPTVGGTGTDYWVFLRRAYSDYLNGVAPSLDVAEGAQIIEAPISTSSATPSSNLIDCGANPTDGYLWSDNALADASLKLGDTVQNNKFPFSVTPVGRGGAGTSEFMDLSFSFTPGVDFSSRIYTVQEPSGSAEVTFRRRGSTTAALTMIYDTVDYTALSPNDYTNTSGSVSWAAGDNGDKTISIPLSADTIDESMEFFGVRIKSVTGGTNPRNEAIVQIGAGPEPSSRFLLPYEVNTFSLGTDGRVVTFENYTNSNLNRIEAAVRRFNRNGSADPAFQTNSGVIVGTLAGIESLPDGRFVLFGSFSLINGVARTGLAVLDSTGRLDTSFAPVLGIDLGVVTVRHVAPLSDGGIIITGAFTSVGGVSRAGVAKLDAMGRLDANFTAATGVTWPILELPSGGYVAGWSGANPATSIMILNPDGGTSPSINSSLAPQRTAAPPTTATLLPDRSVMIAGGWCDTGNAPSRPFMRIDSVSGAVLPDSWPSDSVVFAPNSAPFVKSLVVMPDGSLILSGRFSAQVGPARLVNVVRLLPGSGMPDFGFDPGIGINFVDGIADSAFDAFGVLWVSPWFQREAQHDLATFNSFGGPSARAELAQSSDRCPEGQSAFVMVNRLGSNVGQVSVNFRTVASTAEAGSDFTPTTGTLTWADGDTAPKVVRVPVLADTANDLGETFSVRLSFPSGCVLGATTVMTVTIDPPSPPIAPIAVTTAATNVTARTATLNGTINAKGSDTTAGFEYGLTNTYGSTVNIPSLAGGNTSTPFSATLSGLLPHRLYHYRIRGTNSIGMGKGANLTFTTLNTMPIATVDSLEALPGGVLVITPLANDVDTDGDVLTLTSVILPPATQGKAVRTGNTITFTPASTFSGTSINYNISDGAGGTATGRVDVALASASISPSSLELTADRSSNPVSVTTTAQWSVVESLSWVTPSITNGSGSSTISLVVAANTSLAAREGIVTVAGQPLSIYQAGVLPPGIAVPASIPTGTVSGSYSLVIPTTNAPVTYTLSGQHAGLTMDQATGAIVGKPDVAGTRRVKVSAKNAAGITDQISFNITVEPFPMGLDGTWGGLIERSASVNDDLGGNITLLKIGPTGLFTATLRNGALSHRLKGRIDTTPTFPTITLSIPRARRPTITLGLALDHTQGVGSGIVSASLASAAVEVARTSWTSTAPPPLNSQGTFNCALNVAQADLLDATVPHGTGYDQFTVSTLGAVTITGVAADNQVISSSSTLWPDGTVPVFAIMSGGKGSFLGKQYIQADGTVTGNPTWRKKGAASKKDKAYSAGFRALTLRVDGAKYRRSVDPTYPLEFNAPPNNARIEFTDGGISGADQLGNLPQTFALSQTHLATFNAAANPCGVKLTINAAKGIFSGSFALRDTLPAMSSRTATFSGILLNHRQQGQGFFLLTEERLPSTGNQLSGQVILRQP